GRMRRCGSMASCRAACVRSVVRPGSGPTCRRATASSPSNERTGLADVEDPQPLVGELVLGEVAPDALRWLGERLVGELEGAPVHGAERARAELDERVTGVLGVEVLRAHEPARLVGSDGEHRPIDGAEAIADLAKAVEEPGVARVVGAAVGGAVD